MATKKTDEIDPGNEVMKKVGKLNAASKALKKVTKENQKPSSEEVGEWITVIGKALLAIFKR